MSHVKNQHLVPETYLMFFTDTSQKKSCCWLYKKGESGKSKECRPPDQLCKEKYKYEESTFELNEIEKKLSRQESTYKHIIKKVQNKKMLSDEEKINLSDFISTLYHRTSQRSLYYSDKIDEVINSMKHICLAHDKDPAESDEIKR